ncbi:tRNA pseudouridine(38-40) synthase TruA [Oerskovia sp. M15]
MTNEQPVRVRLDLAYQGTAFAGWARQPGLRTVEGTLEDGLGQILRGTRPPHGGGAHGRGVHARGQVAHVDLPRPVWAAMPGRSDREPGRARRAPRGVLPGDVVVRRAAWRPQGSTPASRRSTAATRSASSTTRRCATLRREWVLWNRKPLDADAMHQALQPLLGVRDFAAFCKPRPGATTIRELQHLSWERATEGPDAGLVVAHVRADAFCHNMVRALVGASLAVGRASPVSWPPRCWRRGAGMRAPASCPARPGPRGRHLPARRRARGRAERVRAIRMDEDVWEPNGDGAGITAAGGTSAP